MASVIALVSLVDCDIFVKGCGFFETLFTLKRGIQYVKSKKYIYIYIYTEINAYIELYYICIYVYMYMYIHMCMYICMYI